MQNPNRNPTPIFFLMYMHGDVPIAVCTSILPMTTENREVIFAHHKAQWYKAQSSHHKNSHSGKKCQSSQREENLLRPILNSVHKTNDKIFNTYHCSIQVYVVGRRVKNMNLLQHPRLGDQSDMQAQISPQKTSLQLKIDFWSLPYPVGPFPVLAFEITGGSVSRGFTKVKAWNENPTKASCMMIF